MTLLSVYRDSEGAPDHAAGSPEVYRDPPAIRGALAPIGVTLEQWDASVPLRDDASDAEILAAYRASIDRLSSQHGFQHVDVVSVTPDHPKRDELRHKFLAEHTHAEFEVRFFVAGSGLFCIHADHRVFAVRCDRGDLISVPARTRHWFDMGPRPSFKAIRLFTTPDGWVAEFTGDPIDQRYPRHE